MENHPNMESFEKFIKQQSDEFRMYPSKRVWYSIYNNFHPGRKWPSISMCIVLLSALLMIGYLNTKTNNIAIENSNITQSDNKTLTGQSAIANKLFATNSQRFVYTDKHVKAVYAEKNINNLLASSNKLTATKSLKALPTNNRKITSTVIKLINVTASDEKVMKPASASVLANNTASNNKLYIQNNEVDDADNATSVPQKIFNSHLINKIQTTSTAANISAINFSVEQLGNAANISLGNIATNLTDKQWIENYALYNRPAPRKWKGKLAWQAHFTPSVIFRQLYNNTTGKNISGNIFATTLNNSSINSAVNQTPSIGLEAGLGLQYPILKGLKLKAGLQLNYTRFNISAFGNAHPTATTLVMNNENNGQAYELSRSTPYSNIIGLNPETLHNQTYQLSLPIGADIKLAGIDNLEWYAGATIQPTFVFAGSSYLISTDRRNYVKENSMLNHFNMNAGFETYISFKTAAGLSWQIGPQFRKQLFSTNSKQFSIEERLMSYGLKIGISKKL